MTTLGIKFIMDAKCDDSECVGIMGRSRLYYWSGGHKWDSSVWSWEMMAVSYSCYCWCVMTNFILFLSGE